MAKRSQVLGALTDFGTGFSKMGLQMMERERMDTQTALAQEEEERKKAEETRQAALFPSQKETVEAGAQAAKTQASEALVQAEKRKTADEANRAMEAENAAAGWTVDPEDSGNIGTWKAELSTLNRFRAREDKPALSVQEFLTSKKDQKRTRQSEVNEETRKGEKHAADLKGTESEIGYRKKLGDAALMNAQTKAATGGDTKNAGKLLGMVNNDERVKNFRKVGQEINVIDTAWNNFQKNPGQSKNYLDQTLISTFNKINDPTSVVRESEYARTPEGMSLMNRISGALDRLQQGGAGLTDDDRKTLVETAKVIGQAYERNYVDAISAYKEIGDAWSVPPDKFFGKQDLTKLGIASAAATPAATTSIAIDKDDEDLINKYKPKKNAGK